MLRCVTCGLWKPEADFAFQNEAAGRRQGQCRRCQAEYRRGHYLRNREIYLQRENTRMRGYREENRVRLFEYLSVHPCVDCGETEPTLLDFDHRDPATKRSGVAKLAGSKPWHQVLAEIEKCDVRCANCHRRRTARQFAWGKLTRRVRPWRSNVRRKRATSSRSTTSSISWLEIVDVKRCCACRVTKALTEFSLKNKETGRRSSKCRPCQAEYSRRHYRRNREVYLRRASARRKRGREICRQEAYEHLTTHPCVDCGETDPVVLDFDHRDPALKRGTVSRMVSQGSWTTVAAEIAQCDVRCANCHRRRTAAQQDWFSSRQVASNMRPMRE